MTTSFHFQAKNVSKNIFLLNPNMLLRHKIINVYFLQLLEFYFSFFYVGLLCKASSPVPKCGKADNLHWNQHLGNLYIWRAGLNRNCKNALKRKIDCQN